MGASFTSFDALIPRLYNPDPTIAELAAFDLGELGDNRAAPFLADLLSSPNDALRLQVAIALNKIESPSTRPALIRALGDTYKPVVLHVAVALAKMQERQAIMPLMQIVLSETGRPESINIAAEAIGEIRTNEVLALLARHISDQRFEVRTAIVSALGTFGGRQALRYIVESLTDSSMYVRRNAAMRVGEIGYFEERAILKQRLENEPEISVREALESSIAQIEERMLDTN